jgi:hypothetical protein
MTLLSAGRSLRSTPAACRGSGGVRIGSFRGIGVGDNGGGGVDSTGQGTERLEPARDPCRLQPPAARPPFPRGTSRRSDFGGRGVRRGKQGRRDGSRVRCRVWTTAVDPDDTERPTCSRPRRCCPPRWASWRSVDLDEAADPGWRPCPESAAWWWRCRCGGAQIRLVGFVHLRWEEVVRCASKNSSPMPASGHGSWWFTPRT